MLENQLFSVIKDGPTEVCKSQKYRDDGFYFEPLLDLISRKDLDSLRDEIDLKCVEKITLTKDLDCLGLRINQLFRQIFDRLDCVTTLGTTCRPLPWFHIARNYTISKVFSAYGGWHRDAGGEYRLKECRKLLQKDTYRFAKLGIYLQRNDENRGGAIDVIPGSHRWSRLRAFLTLRSFEVLRILARLISVKCVEKIDQVFCLLMRVKTVGIENCVAVVFDSRILHRGTPNKGADKFRSSTIPATCFETISNKLVLYCHVGNKVGVDSYLLERVRREQSRDEFDQWVQELEFFNECH